MMKINFYNKTLKIILYVSILLSVLSAQAYAQKIRVRLADLDGQGFVDTAKTRVDDGTKLTKVKDRRYRGRIEKIERNGQIYWINILDLTDYLYGVVPGEMPSSWPEDALKAQAICARTFARKQMSEREDDFYDVMDKTSSQIYLGYDGETTSTKKAVDETDSLYLKYNGDYISAVYHSNSGGHTADSESIWSSKVDYLRGVDDPYSLDSPKASWTFDMDKDKLAEILDKNLYGVGRIKSIEPQNISDDGRVQNLRIVGDAGIQNLSKEKIRQVLGYNQIKSTWYSVHSEEPIYVLDLKKGKTVEADIQDMYSINSDEKVEKTEDAVYILSADEQRRVESLGENVTFKGKGYGHGVGLSQWGAKNMANLGFDFEEILKFYYWNVDLISEE
ncbi:MAG: SpoIID/LytB domain-containing protein [Tissierellales bacterium]|jgi:stage II sporulation protein D|nr:SpoIID/LytB domain-containing protein [Tissierellales bacterium]